MNDNENVFKFFFKFKSQCTSAGYQKVIKIIRKIINMITVITAKYKAIFSVKYFIIARTR